MQLPFMDQPQLLSHLMFGYRNEYDLGTLCCVSKPLCSIAIQYILWKAHLARRSPSLAFTSNGNCRKLLVQLELQNPRADIKRFRFFIDIKCLDSDDAFQFSSLTDGH